VNVDIGSDRSKIGDPTGKAGQIVSVMEQRLMLGFYKPGEMVSFQRLADEFKVSRQPVSAAISHLRASGYVEVIPQVGCKVVHPSPSEIRDFFTVLGRVEAAVVAMAAARHKASEAADLLALMPVCDLDALDDMNQRKAYIGYVDRFHVLIWTMARSPLLDSKLSGLRRLSNFYLWQGLPTLAPAAAKALIAERTEIARAVMARDASSAALLMERHISAKPQLIGL
jgi:DNA-binding GntR family transcriptional regulator